MSWIAWGDIGVAAITGAIAGYATVEARIRSRLAKIRRIGCRAAERDRQDAP